MHGSPSGTKEKCFVFFFYFSHYNDSLKLPSTCSAKVHRYALLALLSMAIILLIIVLLDMTLQQSNSFHVMK